MRLAVWLAAALLLAGCGTTSAPSAVSSPSSSAVAASQPAATADVPTHLTFDAIGVDADLSPTGLAADGTIAVPALDKAAEVDYLAWSPEFGAGRPVTVVSHVNGRNSAGKVIPGGFLHLKDAKTGDRVTVTSASGASAMYRVTSVRTVPKASFPSDVYRVRSVPTLVLITCGGSIPSGTHSYDSNVITEAVAA